MVSKDVLVESPHSLTMYLKLMFREAVNLRVVIDCVLCVYTFVTMMIMVHVQIQPIKSMNNNNDAKGSRKILLSGFFPLRGYLLGLKMMFFVSNKVRNGQKGHTIDQRGLKVYEKGKT